jgi:hypothetical protein
MGPSLNFFALKSSWPKNDYIYMTPWAILWWGSGET